MFLLLYAGVYLYVLLLGSPYATLCLCGCALDQRYFWYCPAICFTLSRVQFTPDKTLPIHTEPGFTLMLLAGRIIFLLIHVCPECVMTLVLHALHNEFRGMHTVTAQSQQMHGHTSQRGRLAEFGSAISIYIYI